MSEHDIKMLLIGAAIGFGLWVLYKVIRFLIILANPDNLPGFNLFKSWWK